MLTTTATWVKGMPAINLLRGLFNRLFGRWADKPTDQQYYVKMFFAIVTALVCSAGGRSFAGIRGIMFGLLMYVLTLYILVYIMGIDVVALGGRQKLVTNSLVSFLLLWVVLWTLLYAFTLPESVLSTLAVFESCATLL